VICGVLYCAIASDLDTPSRSFKLFFSENKYSLLLWSLVKSSSNEGIDNADDLERALKVISGTIYIRFHCISNTRHTYNVRTPLERSDIICEQII